MNHITKQIITDLKHALKTGEPTLTGQATSFSYYGNTDIGKPQKGETFELIDDTAENPPTPKGFDIIKDIEQAVQ